VRVEVRGKAFPLKGIFEKGWKLGDSLWGRVPLREGHAKMLAKTTIY